MNEKSAGMDNTNKGEATLTAMDVMIERMIDIITKVVMSLVRVNIRDEKVVRDHLKNFLYGWAKISEVDMDTNVVFGQPFSETYVPNQLARLFIPRSVRLNPSSRESGDLVEREKYTTKGYDVTYSDFLNSAERIVGWMKVTPELKPLKDILEDVPVTQAVERAIYDDNVHYDGISPNARAPFYMSTVVGMKDYFYNTDLDRYIEELWRDVLKGM